MKTGFKNINLRQRIPGRRAGPPMPRKTGPVVQPRTSKRLPIPPSGPRNGR